MCVNYVDRCNVCVLTNHPEGSVKFSLVLKSSTAAIKHTDFVCLSVFVCEYLSECESVCTCVTQWALQHLGYFMAKNAVWDWSLAHFWDTICTGSSTYTAWCCQHQGHGFDSLWRYKLKKDHKKVIHLKLAGKWCYFFFLFIIHRLLQICLPVIN